VAFDDLDNMVSYPMQIMTGHSVKRQDISLPNIGQHVLCAFLDNGNQEGFVLGSYFTAQNLPKGGKPGVYRTEYEDGTVIEYDLNTSTARISSKNTINIEAKNAAITAETLAIKGNVTIDGNLSVTGAGDGTAVINGNVTVNGSLNASGNIIDGGSNTNHHNH
jgi:phage baseplate assembly protein V